MRSTTILSSFTPWFRLLRIANLPSAISNILMGFLLVHQSWSPALELGLLILASSSLYLAGMVLNDFFDFEVDLRERPGRPLPAHQISRRMAGLTGFVLLCLGIGFACIAGFVANQHTTTDSPASPLFRPGLIAIGLAVLIVLYDGPLKRTIAAPFLMGGCRMMNILLAASTFVGPALATESATGGDGLFLGLPGMVWWVAVAIGALITGTTLLGRREAVEIQSRTPLVVAGVIILASLTGLALVVYCPTTTLDISERMQTVFPLFIVFISVTIARRVVSAVAIAQPRAIQQGVISILRSLIIFDAALCYLAVPSNVVYPLIVIALLVPTMLLGRWIPST